MKNILVFIIVAFLLSIIIIFSPFFATTLCFAFIISILFLKYPLKALAIFLIITPLSGTFIFNNTIMNIPGAKPLYFLSLFVIVISFYNHEKCIVMPKITLIFSTTLIFILLISVLRSYQYLDIINFFKEDKLSNLRYFLSALVRPLIYFMPFIIIIKFAKEKNQIEFIVNTMVVSIVLLSIYLIYLYIFKIDNLMDIRRVNNYFEATLNIHRNGIANFYILGFPLLLAWYFLNKNIIAVSVISISVICIGFLYSRTAYLTIFLSVVIYMIISKRKKIIPVYLLISFLISLVMAQSIIERMYKGIDTKDINEISAGRTNDIWIPLIMENISNPKKLLFGNGRYGILNSDVSKSGVILDVKHPHNMYLELFIDSGIIGLIGIMSFLIIILRNLYRSTEMFTDNKYREYQYAIIVSIIAYFISGLTGRSLFPDLNNSYLWIILGIGFSLLQTIQLPSHQRN